MTNDLSIFLQTMPIDLEHQSFPLDGITGGCVPTCGCFFWKVSLRLCVPLSTFKPNEKMIIGMRINKRKISSLLLYRFILVLYRSFVEMGDLKHEVMGGNFLSEFSLGFLAGGTESHSLRSSNDIAVFQKVFHKSPLAAKCHPIQAYSEMPSMRQSIKTKFQYLFK